MESLISSVEMQDYNDIAAKNGVSLLDEGHCQFCGAETNRGVHECVEIFSLGFHVLDFAKEENHYYRFLSVDAHTLQHPEIHGRWNNHFHLARLHLMFKYKVAWNYKLSPKLSDHLNHYKKDRSAEYLKPPKVNERGSITTTDVLALSSDEKACQKIITEWGLEVYHSWQEHHPIVDNIAKGFIANYGAQLTYQ